MSAVPAEAERSALARRAILMVVLWLGFWLLTFGLILGLLWIPLGQLYFRDTMDIFGTVAAGASLTLAYALRPRLQPQVSSGPAALQRVDAPALFALIDGVAGKLCVDAPFEIRLVSESTAFIGAERSWTGRIKKLYIGLGLPLFAWLSEEELGAVIAHEFGHFIGGDLALGPWVYRTRASIAVVVDALDDSFFFLDAPYRIYAHWFLRLSSAISRQQEFSADALAGRHFGNAAICAALEKIYLIEPVWSAYFHHDLLPALDSEVRMPIFDGFRRFCAASPKRRDVQKAIDEGAYVKPSLYDTHPSLQDRLAALGHSVSDSLSPPASSFQLIGGEEQGEHLWYQRMDTNEWRAIAWEEFGESVLRSRLDKKFADTELAPPAMSLTELPAMVRSLDDWWMKLGPGRPSFLSPEAKRRHVMDVLREWIMVSLCHAGFVLKVRPGLDPVLEREGIVIEPAALLASACAGTLAPGDLSAYTTRHAVSIDTEISCSC